MSYKYETGRTSPNATDNSRVAATWGRPRTIEAIAIHWWGDPKNKPTYEGVVDYLCRPGGVSSAHFVITGTNRRAAQIVDFDDAAWATNSANPYTIALELDPRARPEDYDVAAEVIAQIWDAYGHKPLVPHNQFVATACPGVYDLRKLESIAKTKDGSGPWGTVKNRTTTPTPKPTEPTHDNLYRLFVDGKQVAAYSKDQNAYIGWEYYGRKGKITHKGLDVTSTIVDKYKPKPPVETPKPNPEPEKPEPEEPNEPETPEQPSEEKSPLNVFIRALKEFWESVVDIWNAKY